MIFLLLAVLYSSAYSCAPSISDRVRRKSIYEATHSLAAGRLKFQTTTFSSIPNKENIIIKSSTRPLSMASTTKPIFPTTQPITTIFRTTERIETAPIILTTTESHRIEVTTTRGPLPNRKCTLKDIGSELRNIPVNMDESEALIEFLENSEREQSAILTCRAQSGKTTIMEISGQPSLRDESVEEDTRLIVVCTNGHWLSESGFKVIGINCYHINSFLEQFK